MAACNLYGGTRWETLEEVAATRLVCCACGLVFVTPQPSRPLLARAYDEGTTGPGRATPGAGRGSGSAGRPRGGGRRARLYESDRREVHLSHFSARTVPMLVASARFEVIEVGFDRGRGLGLIARKPGTSEMGVGG